MGILLFLSERKWDLMLSSRTACATSLVNSWFHYRLARVGLVCSLMGNENYIQRELLISFNGSLWGRSHNPSECLFRKSVSLQTFRFVGLILHGNHNLILTKLCRAFSDQGYTARRWNNSVPLGHRVSYSNGRPQLPCSCTLQWVQRCPGMVAFYSSRFLWQWKLEHLK